MTGFGTRPSSKAFVCEADSSSDVTSTGFVNDSKEIGRACYACLTV
jgi:hypothetical protein